MFVIPTLSLKVGSIHDMDTDPKSVVSVMSAGQLVITGGVTSGAKKNIDAG